MSKKIYLNFQESIICVNPQNLNLFTFVQKNKIRNLMMEVKDLGEKKAERLLDFWEPL